MIAGMFFLLIAFFWLYPATVLASSFSAALPEATVTITTEDDDDGPLAERLIMIIIDGIRYDHGFGSGATNMPYLYGQLGPIASINTNFFTETLTSTNSGHASMVTGTWQVLRNDGSERPTMPTFFEYLRDQRGLPAEACHVVTGKPKLDVLTHCTHPHFGPDYGGVATASANFQQHIDSGEVWRTDFEVFDNAIRIMQEEKPEHMVITFPAVDIYGHMDRFNDYIRAIRTADSLVYQIWQYIESDPFYAGKTIMTVTNDHGRHDDSHGGFQHHGCGCNGCRHIMFLAVGPGIKMNMTTDVRRTLIDILPTAAEALGGIENPLWQGNVMKEILTFDVEDPVYVPPVADGVIGPNEYGIHFDDINRGSTGSQRWYMTYDETNLYIALRNANRAEGAVVYIDIDPLAPINGGSNANGSFAGQSYDGTNMEKLPFRGDYVMYFKDGYREIRQANGSGGWGSARTSFGTYASSSNQNTRELIIPWTEFGFDAGTRPDKFAWIGYVAYRHGSVSGVYGQIPSANPRGETDVNVMRPQRYYIVDTTLGDAPFSKESYVFNRNPSRGNITAFGGIDVYDFTMNSPGRGITRTGEASSSEWYNSTAWNIRGDLRVDDGFIHFGDSRSGVLVLGDVHIGPNATLTLSNRVGGDLDVRGNWNGEGTFDGNNRQVSFRGIHQQTLNQRMEFDYLDISNSEGLVPLDTIFVGKRIILGGGQVFNSELINVVLEDDILIRRDEGLFTVAPIFNGSVRLEYAGYNQLVTGLEVPPFPVRELTINKESGVIIGDQPIHVLDRLRMNNGSLTVPEPDRLVLLSSDTLTARISGLAPIHGEMTMQRYLSGGAGWRMMSSPLGGANLSQLSSELPLQGFPGSHPSAPRNLFTGYNGATWTSPQQLNTTLDAGQAFLVYLYNNSQAGSRELPFTMQLTGSEPAMDVTVPLHADGDRWNFVGNPFASAIDVRQLEVIGGALTSTVGQIWNSGDDQNGGSWELTTAHAHRLAPWQGMIVNNSHATSLRIPKSARIAGDGFMRAVDQDYFLPFRLDGTDAETGQHLSDRSIVLYFHEDAVFGADLWDVSKIGSLNPVAIQGAFRSSDSEGGFLAQKSIPATFSGDVEIPFLVYNHGYSGDVTLSWSLDRLPENGMEVFLEDTRTGRVIDVYQSNAYTFSVVANESQSFVMKVKGGAATHLDSDQLPQHLALRQNFPNPFNPVTRIEYALPDMQHVRLDVFDITGRRVAVLVDDVQPAGQHAVQFDARRLASGVYIYRLTAGGQQITRRMTLIK